MHACICGVKSCVCVQRVKDGGKTKTVLFTFCEFGVAKGILSMYRTGTKYNTLHAGVS